MKKKKFFNKGISCYTLFITDDNAQFYLSLGRKIQAKFEKRDKTRRQWGGWLRRLNKVEHNIVDTKNILNYNRINNSLENIIQGTPIR